MGRIWWWMGGSVVFRLGGEGGWVGGWLMMVMEYVV